MSPQEMMTIVPREERKKFSNGELGGLLAAFGNHEAKALLLASMRRDVLYTSADLLMLMITSQGKNPVWRMGGTNSFDYCERSLAPVGMVVKEVLNENLSTYGFIKTAYGEEVGDALAGHLLSFSERHPSVSLMDLFAKTGIPSDAENTERDDKRAPITRYKIFLELLTHKLPVREADLVERLGIRQVVISAHLRELSRKNIIEYDAIEMNKPIATFRLSENQPAGIPIPFKHLATLTEEVRKALFQIAGDEISAESVLDFIKTTNHKGDLRRDAKRAITEMLSYFERLGYLERTGFSTRKRSEIRMTDEQRITLLDLTSLLGGILTRGEDFLEEGRRKAVEIVNDPDRFSNLLKKAREHSSFANKVDSEKFAERLLLVIGNHPGVTLKELQVLVKEEFGIETTRDNIRYILKKNIENKSIGFLKDGRTYHYSLTKPE